MPDHPASRSLTAQSHSLAPRHHPVALTTDFAHDHPVARRLTAALHDEQLRTYGVAEDPAETPPSHFTPRYGLFVIARSDVVPDEEAIGCGGIRMRDDCTAEIKRMYVSARARGCGVGYRILDHLDTYALSVGVNRLVLETGYLNTAALALYLRNGYQHRASYVTGRDPVVNRAMTKPLTR